MTFSIVARCPRTGQIGVAAATAIADKNDKKKTQEEPRIVE